MPYDAKTVSPLLELRQAHPARACAYRSAAWSAAFALLARPWRPRLGAPTDNARKPLGDPIRGLSGHRLGFERFGTTGRQLNRLAIMGGARPYPRRLHLPTSWAPTNTAIRESAAFENWRTFQQLYSMWITAVYIIKTVYTSWRISHGGKAEVVSCSPWLHGVFGSASVRAQQDDPSSARGSRAAEAGRRFQSSSWSASSSAS